MVEQFLDGDVLAGRPLLERGQVVRVVLVERHHVGRVEEPVPVPAEVRAKMLQPEDLGEGVVFAASMPLRANVWRIDMTPTRKRARRP